MKLTQVSFTGGELDPAIGQRVDLALYAKCLKTCSNYFVRATGGVSNRAGLQFVFELDADSLAALIPFTFSTDQTYMMVLQEGTVSVFADGGFVAGVITRTITNVSVSGVTGVRTITTSVAHGFSTGDIVTIEDVDATGDYKSNGTHAITSTPLTTTFTISARPLPVTGAYNGGGTVTLNLQLTTSYLSEELADIRYTQSADVVTLTHQAHVPSEIVRTAATTFTFGAIDDFDTGPFLDESFDGTTITASAATGTGITLTVSVAKFEAGHVGALVRIDLTDISAIPPWEPNKLLASVGVNPLNLQRIANGKVYICTTNQVAGANGTYTGTVRPSHDEGAQADGDGNPISGSSRAGVEWTYLHSLFGIARITAVAGDGLSATADVLTYIPVVSPATTESWAFGAWSEVQGYPAVVTYFGDRLVFANTPMQPQTEWASKVGIYHDFGESSPLVDDDAITQTLNARQVNAIVELSPADQLVALTASSSWASPSRGEVWTPATVGFDPQSFTGAANLRSVQIGDSGVFVQRGATKLRELKFLFDIDKFGGPELSVLARHLFGPDMTIVDLDYAAEPYGILWLVRSDGALIGLTYLPEQEVIGWHRHNTDGFFERVCVITEDNIDVPYFVVRRTINGSTVRYLERMASREFDDQLDGFFVDSGLSFDGRNTTSTTITVSGASYDGGDTVTLTASASLFASTDVGDAIQLTGITDDEGDALSDVRIDIIAYTSATEVTGELQTPCPEERQAVATTDWTFARDTFSGLDHLEGETVAICADGSVLEEQEVSGGAVTIENAAGVVHIGLPYVAEIETLDVTVYGSDPIRDRAKLIPKAAIVIQDTVGLQIGPNEDNLEDIALREDEYYTEPTAATTGVATGYMVNTLNVNGRLLVRQSNPLPSTILAIIPHVELGGDG